MRKWTWPGVASFFSQTGIWVVLLGMLVGVRGCNTPTPIPETSLIALPATLNGEAGKQIKIVADTEGVDVVWWCDPPGHLAWSAKDSKEAVVSGADGQRLIVFAVTAIQNKKQNKWLPAISNKCTVTFGKAPDPIPPGPTPTPTPLPSDGFRVLIVRQTSGVGVKPAQQVALQSAKLREYLQSHCIKVGNQPEIRMFDPDQDMSKESKTWQDAMVRAKSDMQKDPVNRDKPWLLAINKTTGISTLLPDTLDDIMKALEPIGGK